MDVSQFAKDAKGAKRDFVFIVNESLRNECTEEARQMVYVVDVTNETTPFPVVNYDVPEESGSFCSRGGRFGAHSSNENQPPMYAKRMLFFTWSPQGARCKIEIQSNNVEVDDRGYIYVGDRTNTGLHILELTGSARAVANFR
ncbi:MAG: hypothetical protein ACRET3_11465 [Burkholderiales bacterium]